MTPGKSFQKITGFIPGQRNRFFENLISSLAVEAELLYPDRVKAGVEYDKRIGDMAAIISVKGKIHAYYKLHCRGDLIPDRRMEDPKFHNTDDVFFLSTMLDELEPKKELQIRFREIIEKGILAYTKMSLKEGQG